MRPDALFGVAEKLETNTRRTENGCLEWTGWVDADGFATFKLDGESVTVSRVAWELARGPIPQIEGHKIIVRHRCKNPKCVDIEHLFLGLQDLQRKDKVPAAARKKGSPSPDGTLVATIDVHGRIRFPSPIGRVSRERVREMLKAGHRVQVVHVLTGADATAEVLSTLIARIPESLPVALLEALVRDGPDSVPSARLPGPKAALRRTGPDPVVLP